MAITGDLLNLDRTRSGSPLTKANAEFGELYLWGSNEHRKLGFRKRNLLSLPKKMKPKYFGRVLVPVCTVRYI